MKRECENQHNKMIAGAMLFGLIFILILSVVYTPMSNGQLLTEDPTGIRDLKSQEQVPNIEFVLQNKTVSEIDYEEDTIYIGLWLINVYGFDYVTRDYVFDMFVYFFWTNPNVMQIDWYLMNGYPVNPASNVLVDSNVSSEVKFEIYRTTATLSGDPDGKDYPFDNIKLPISIELIKHGIDLRVEWIQGETGIDPSFSNAGWETINIELLESVHDYPLDAQLPRAEMILTQKRVQSNVVMESLFPIFVFGLISGCSFLFVLSESNAVGLRLGLNTSMLVTTLLFNFAVSPNIPASSTYVIYDMVMYSILLFIIANLVVTTIGYVLWFYYKNEERTKLINRAGFLISLIVPILFFTIILLIRS